MLIRLMLMVGLLWGQEPELETFAGDFVFLDHGWLYQYEDGAVNEVCRVPKVIDSTSLPQYQFSDREDVAYAPETGLVALAVNHMFTLADYEPQPDDRYAAKNLYLCDLATNRIRQISPSPNVGFFHDKPVFSPDGTQMVWIETNTDFESRVLQYDINSDTITTLYTGLRRASIIERRHIAAVVWDASGIVVRGLSTLCGADQDTLIFISDGVTSEHCEQTVWANAEFVQPVLFWAVAQDRPVVVYSMFGMPNRVQYMDPATGEHFTADGAVRVEPAAAVNGGTPFLWLEVIRISDRLYTVATSSGPMTLDGYPGGFAFSEDGTVLAMLVTEGLGVGRGGTDLYLLRSSDTLGALGYYVRAQRVSQGYDWSPDGVEAVYWGSQVYICEGQNEISINT